MGNGRIALGQARFIASLGDGAESDNEKGDDGFGFAYV